MNQFQLPGCLIIEEGACERLNEILADCIPGIEKKKIVIVTEEPLIPIMKPYLDEMKRDLPESELYLIDANSFDEAMELAKHICMEDIEVIIGVGGGKVLDVAKYAGFVGKIPYICVPTTLSNDSLASPVSVLGTEGDARKTCGGRECRHGCASFPTAVRDWRHYQQIHGALRLETGRRLQEGAGR